MSINSETSLRLGTRGSALARWQADWVADRLRAAGVPVQLVLLETRGDVRRGSLGSIGGTGLFTKEIQLALLDDTVDLAVHSLKDLPTEPVDGLRLAAVPARASCRDVLVTGQADSLAALPAGSRIGTGSIRRRAQLLHARADLEILDIRGNVDTRLQKLDQGQYDAIILAEAGLRRLGWEDRLTQVLPWQSMLPAVGQGALGLEIRADDADCAQRIGLLDDPDSHRAVLAERALLAALRAGCLAPVGAWARMQDGQLVLDAAVLAADGSQRLTASIAGPADHAVQLGQQAAQSLLEQGAAELIHAARQQP
jgi:hydroxymethylbilane synthase